MADEEHLQMIRQGVDVWNQWRQKNPKVVQPDLRAANLYAIDLRKANLREANLREANLWGADLWEADLWRADLEGAKLGGAGLAWAHLWQVDLRRADLRGAHLQRTDLHQAFLQGANLWRADLTGANLSVADLREVNLQEANLENANLHGAQLIGTDLCNATLTGSNVYGVSVWDVKVNDGTKQQNLIIKDPDNPDQPVITVDDIEVAQFIYLLLNRRKLRNVITTLGEKAVLILGRFTERKELLDSMAIKLRELDYLPIIFDFERPADRDLTDTVKVLAGLSRFVIADITNPRSVPYELGATVPDYMVPFVTILQRGQPAFGMFDDLPRRYHWALPLLEYQSAETLLAAFESKVVAPALEKLEEVRRQKALLPARRSAED